MPYDKNEHDYPGAPKKADIIIRSTQNIALKQEELAEQTKQVVSRIQEAIDLFSKSGKDSDYVVKQSGEIFTQLQGENSALKQELLYLAKQSENIYAGLAEKITELSDGAKKREQAMEGFSDRLNDVAEQAKKSENAFSQIVDKLTALNSKIDALATGTQNTRTVIEKQPSDELAAVSDRLAVITDMLRRNERAYDDLSARVSQQLSAKDTENSDYDIAQLAEKMNRISEQLRRNDSAHSMLADKFEILSMRLDQYPYNSYQQNSQYRRQDQPAELDYDKLAAKVADLISTREVVSPDYIASRVAEQIVIPGTEPTVNVSVDAEAIAGKIAEKISVPQANAYVDHDYIANAVAQRIPVAEPQLDMDYLASKVAEHITVPEVEPQINLDYLSDRIARQIVLPPAEPANVSVAIDMDYVAQKVAENIAIPAAEVNVDTDEVAAKVAQNIVIPAAEPITVNIDTEEIAAKVAERITIPQAEIIDADYVASKVAEQIVIPGTEPANVNVSVDADLIARQVADLLSGTEAAKETPVSINTPVSISLDEEGIANKVVEKLGGLAHSETAATVALDEEGLAERLAQKLGSVNSEVAPVEFDEEGLASRIAEKLGGFRPAAVPVPVGASSGIDEEELADAISLKVGSLKAEDFEILVDDDGCSSISKSIANSLDYNMISNIIADKLREALDLAAVNAPDYEEMAERISEKITVAGINEDAIADKAAAVLSNYLPEFDTDEITDKITGAVIDVVSAMPQPTLDSEAICNAISERLIESQEDHDYDIVIDDDGISRITELVTEEIRRGTDERFDKVEDGIAKLSELLENTEEEADAAEDAEEPVEEEIEEAEEVRQEVISSVDYAALSEMVAGEVGKLSDRFDSVEQGIAKLNELMSAEEVYEEEYESDEDYSAITDAISAELENTVVSRLDAMEESLDKLNGLMSERVERAEEYTPADINEEYAEAEAHTEAAEEVKAEDYSVLSEAVASEVEKRVSCRIDSLEEKLTGFLTFEDVSEDEAEEEYSEEEYAEADEEEVEEETEEIEEVDEYAALTEVVRNEVSARLDGIEERLASITELMTAEEVEDEVIDDAEEESVEEVYEDTEEEVAEEDYTLLSEAVADAVEKRVTERLSNLEDNVAKITDIITAEPVEEAAEEQEEEDYTALSEVVAAEIRNEISARLDSIEENVAKISEAVSAEEDGEIEEIEEDYTQISEAVAAEVEKRVAYRFDNVEENVARLTAIVESGVKTGDGEDGVSAAALSVIIAAEIERGVSGRLDSVDENITKLTELITSDEEDVPEYEEYEVLNEAEDLTGISEAVATELEKRVSYRFDSLEENVAKLSEMLSAEENAEQIAISENITAEVEKLNARFGEVEENIAKLTEILSAEEELPEEDEEEYAEDYTGISEAVATEVEKRVAYRLDGLEENVAKLTEMFTVEEDDFEESEEEYAEDYTGISEAVATEVEKRVSARFDAVEEHIAKMGEKITVPATEEVATDDYTVLSEAVASEVEKRVSYRLDNVEENIARISAYAQTNARFTKIEESIAKLSEYVENGADKEKDKEKQEPAEEKTEKAEQSDKLDNDKLDSLDDKLDKIDGKFEGEFAQIKDMLATASETAAAQAEAIPEEEEPLVTVSDLVRSAPAEEEFEEEEEEDDGEDDFLIDVLDVDAFSDNELMPGEGTDYDGGVDFANMMKFKRSFIARIIQSEDEYKQFYGEVKHALLSYRKVNSNVAWGAERFNKGRETIARMKIRGKTLCLYLALDPNEHKTSVYHHLDVSDNKSVAGTPMMVKVKSPLGVRKAIRLIDEMLAQRNGEKREIPERDYAAMYPYETIEELIEDGLVKDVRKK